MECSEMSFKKKVNKKLRIALIVLISLVIVGLVILVTYNVKLSQKNAQIKEINDSIIQAETTPKILQKAVDAYAAFLKDTDSQTAFGYIPGFGALTDVDALAYGTHDEQTKRCNWDVNGHLTNAVNEQQESVGKLSGSDQVLLETWNKEAATVADWVMCYKGVLVYNKAQAKNGIDDFKSVSLKIKGRVTVLEDDIKKDKSNLQQLESKNALFL